MAITKGEIVLVLVAAVIGAAGSIGGAVLTGNQTVTQVFQGPQTITVTTTATATTTTAVSTVTVPESNNVATGQSSSTGAPSAAQPEPDVRHQGPLTLISGNSATDTDLDAPQSDAEWGRVSNTGDASGDAPYISGSRITTGRVGISMKLMGEGDVDYATCAALGEFTGNQIAIGDLKVGSNLCSRTSANRWVRLVVAGEPSGDQIDFEVTVWEPH